MIIVRGASGPFGRATAEILMERTDPSRLMEGGQHRAVEGRKRASASAPARAMRARTAFRWGKDQDNNGPTLSPMEEHAVDGRRAADRAADADLGIEFRLRDAGGCGRRGQAALGHANVGTAPDQRHAIPETGSGRPTLGMELHVSASHG